MRIHTGIIMVFFMLMLQTACRIDPKPCEGVERLSNTAHEQDIQILEAVPEIRAELQKYPGLQVYRVLDDAYFTGMHCRVYYQGLIVFTESYLMGVTKRDRDIVRTGTPFFDTLHVELQPLVSAERAVDIAAAALDPAAYCKTIRLGIFDLNAGTSNMSRNDRLVWWVQAGPRIVVLDARSGEVYRTDTGLRT